MRVGIIYTSTKKQKRHLVGKTVRQYKSSDYIVFNYYDNEDNWLQDIVKNNSNIKTINFYKANNGLLNTNGDITVQAICDDDIIRDVDIVHVITDKVYSPRVINIIASAKLQGVDVVFSR